MRYFAVIIGLVGFILGLGTAGASDLETIPEAQVYLQYAVSFGMLCFSISTIKILNHIRRINYERYHH